MILNCCWVMWLSLNNKTLNIREFATKAVLSINSYFNSKI